MHNRRRAIVTVLDKKKVAAPPEELMYILEPETTEAQATEAETAPGWISRIWQAVKDFFAW